MAKPYLSPTHTEAEQGRRHRVRAHAYIWARATNLDVEVMTVSA